MLHLVMTTRGELLRRLTLVLALTAPLVSATAEQPAYSHASWIEIVDAGADHTYHEGDPWQVTVAWHLDPADERGHTTVSLMAVGPWIDCPDGVAQTKRHHVDYPGANLRGSCAATAGDGQNTFAFTIPKALPHNALLLICRFVNGKGEGFPWEVRAGGPYFTRVGGFFELACAQPANLFSGAEPFVLNARLKKDAVGGGERILAITVSDVHRAVVERQEVRFTPEKEGQEIAVALKTATPGCFLVEAEVNGWERRSTTLCRIPDVLAVTKGEPTAFGMHSAILSDDPQRCELVCAAAQRLGLTVARNFVDWYMLEPTRGRYRFERFDRQLEIARKHGIEPIISLVSPPAWALTGTTSHVAYGAFDGDLDAWSALIAAGTAHWKGKLYAWEWLNEITTGGEFASTSGPTTAYLALCRAGTAAARKADPGIKTLLAGGLWPRSFRSDVLQAGVGDAVDVLPVHYAEGGGVIEARRDLDSVGAQRVAVWDDETGRGMNTFGVPPLDALAENSQSRWIMSQWIDELTAGAERIIDFGGWPDSAGGWSYLLDDGSPRPVCATLALVVAKLHHAKPLGAFWAGRACFELFERDRKAVLCAQPGASMDSAMLQVGATSLTATDYQGVESTIACANGAAQLTMGPVGMFYEGGDLDVLAAYVVAHLQTARSIEPRGGRGSPDFRSSMLTGETSELRIGMCNPYARKLTGTLTLDAGDLGTPPPVAFDLAPGAASVVSIPLAIASNAKGGDHAAQVRVAFAWDKLPTIAEPATIAVISPDMLGNLLKNGDFEAGNAKPWGGQGKIDSAAGLGLGHGAHVLRFAGGQNWQSEGQTVALSPGSAYLYSAWVWNDGMDCGSNIAETFADGKTQTLFDVSVFKLPQSTPSWQLYTMHYTAPSGLVSASFIPVAKGPGWACYDNMRLTLYAGTDYAAEAIRCDKPPRIDGKLDEWGGACPIPLIGGNQLTKHDPTYQWTPDNLSAVAYAMWDDANLYLAIQVRDDHLVPAGEDATVVDGDSVVLAIDPTDRGPDAEHRAFELYLSAQRPGGGSGTTTIYRPAAHSGGLRTGHLARDSSIYEMAIGKVERDVDGTSGWIYELRIPFSELGGFQPGLGRRIALSLQVNDNDGSGPAATMTWGGGLVPRWKPSEFGVLTLTR
jgi:hypothetical protein